MSSRSAGEGEGGVAEALLVRRPFYRAALAAFVFLGVITILWGFFGSIPTRIQGFGEIVTSDGLHSVTSSASGQVESIYVRYGQHVEKGDLLLRLKQPDIADQIDSVKTQIKTVSAELEILRSGDSQSAVLREQLRKLDLARLNAQLEGINSQIAFLEDQVAKQRELLAHGYIVASTLQETQQALNNAKVNRDQVRENIRSQMLDHQQWRVQTDMNEKVKANQLVNLQEQLAVLNDQYVRNTEVRADRAGRVVSINVAPNVVAQRGQSLLVLEEDGAEAPYRFIFYVPFNADSRITKGMRVDVELLTVDHNRYGWLIGTVSDVEDFVATTDQMRNRLQNEELIGKITATGPVYYVAVDLKRDPSTVSGYAWTNRKGPPHAIRAGNLGNGYVHVEERAPVDYLIPIFKKYLD